MTYSLVAIIGIVLLPAIMWALFICAFLYIIYRGCKSVIYPVWK